MKERTGGCQHVTSWTCKHWDLPQPIVPKNLPNHCPGPWTRPLFNQPSHWGLGEHILGALTHMMMRCRNRWPALLI